MQIIKALQCGFISRTMPYKKKHIFVPSLSLAFKLDEAKFLLEPDMWSSIAKYSASLPIWEEGNIKKHAEFFVIGDAISQQSEGSTQMAVEASLGSITKSLLVTGHRHWTALGTKSKPEPFQRMPLDYAHAFGGESFLANPIGKGADKSQDGDQSVRQVPNIEYPEHIMVSRHDKPRPGSFYPKDLIWEERQQLAGTYDDRYIAEQMPGLPDDIDWRFFNMADQDQQFDKFLVGNEAFRLVNMNAEKRVLEGNLPDVSARCFVNKLVDGETQFLEVPLQLDTVWFFPNDNMGVVVHRGSLETSDMFGSDITHLLCAHENTLRESNAHEKRTHEHYHEQMILRSDPNEGYKYMLNTESLLPVGVSCTIADLLGSSLQEQSASDEALQNFADNYRDSVRQDVEKSRDMADEQLATVDLSMDEVDKKQAELEQLAPSKEATQMMALMNKIIPGVGADKADIDLTKLNLKAMDDLNDYMDEVVNTKKEEAIAELEKHLIQLRSYPDDTPGVKASIVELEKAIRDARCPPKPILPRVEFPESVTELNDSIVRAQGMLDGLEDDAAKIDLQATLALDPAEIAAKLAEAKSIAREGYRQGAHHIGDSRSPHEGAEPELLNQLKRKVQSGENCIDDDYAFCDLSGLDLSGIDFTGCYFEYAIINNTNFSNANLTNTVFSKARINDSVFEKAVMTGANFGACHIEDTCFDNAVIDDFTIGNSHIKNSSFRSCRFSKRQDQLLKMVLDGVDLSDAMMQNQNFIEVTMDRVNFKGADLSSSNFVETESTQLDFELANLTTCNFVSVTFHESSFRSAQLDNARFVGGCNLNHADFTSAKITGSNLMNCQLVKTNFSQATVHKTDFSYSVLSSAKFTRADCFQSQYMMANLCESDFTGANLMEASLMQADLRKATFKGANMYAANFYQATLGGTSFTDANLAQTILKDWQPS